MSQTPTNTESTSNFKQSDEEIEELLETLGEALLDKQGVDIKQIDVRGICSYTDFFVVCSADSDVQIKALANSCIVTTGDKLGEKPWKKEGLDSRRWVTLDYVNVVVHIFNKELRDYYKLEKMWSDGIVKEIED